MDMQKYPPDFKPVLQEEHVFNLTEEQKNKVKEIVNTINIEDSQFILQYGTAAQSQVADFADTVLNEIRAKDSGYVGDILGNLVLKIKDLDVDSLSNKQGGFLSRIPFFNSMKSTAEKFIMKYQKIGTEIENIIDELDAAQMRLLKDIAILDNLYEKNYEYLVQLDHYILAGNIKLKEMQEQVLPELKRKAEATKDPLDAQKLNDTVQMLNRFEKKIHDLKLSRTIAIQTAPQIRLIQNNNQVLVEKIQSSILNTIPLWKNQIVIAISLFRQKKAFEVQKQVADTTNELLAKNSELLKDSSVKIAQESERGIVDMETLKKVNVDLIETLEETIKIQEEGRQKRQLAEIELQKIEGELKNKLITLKK